ncbi:hypothetical protein [Variovorax ginsengisoli]|uniref:Uncharacterized protein n=1 Tax=Variovorax ginsengisoli TaxID=363844 RepID=A0ABT9S5S7_9BURK|nr:hypothetical protein [Variovorax ginsengisoli]MDP9899714.1 hypothetical protein [Variovorax ginsengisoli]
MDAPAQTEDARRDAGLFILHMLLQRLEQQQPGLMDGMIDGILSDRAAMLATDEPNGYPRRIGDEALRILRLANDQLKIPWEPLRKG